MAPGPPQSKECYPLRRASWDQQQVTAVDLEELTLRLGSTSHHCTEFLIVDSTIL